ncbi:hypothetical protein HY605_04990 [Candidatus Peregrinibacteria bacterium]|nr:hypothetical protein [Candidatus Peregrinibacteria bacterium]
MGVFRPVLYSADTVVISFEQEESFSAATNESSFNDLSTNGGIVTAWTVENEAGATYIWGTDDGPGGVKFPDAPAPISGKQIGGLISTGGHGIAIGTMHLNKKSNYTLTSFYWAYRGNGDSRPGGNAYLELEYFDMKDKSIGKEKFQGGLNPDMSPNFDLVRVSAQYQSVAMSKVIFKSVCPNPEVKMHATFLMEDMTLSIAGKSVSAPSESKVSQFKQVDTTPPMVRLPNPPPDSTVNGNVLKDESALLPVTISVDFADSGSGIDPSSAKILLDGKDVTAQAKVTERGLSFGNPLGKGIHQVDVSVSDKAGNLGNRQRWRFGVGVPIVVKSEFKGGVFYVSGEPYFPMGAYNGAMSPENPDKNKWRYRVEASVAGINCQLLSESLAIESLDVMLQLGMKAMKCTNASIERIVRTDNQSMVEMAKGTKDHPAMLGWWASDIEGIGTQKGNAMQAYKVLKEQDPNHVIVWCAACDYEINGKKIVDTEDACFSYMYPIGYRDGTILSIVPVVQRLLQSAEPQGKHVWWASQEIDMRINQGERIAPEDFRPTPAEMRAMNYLVLALGAKGLFLYAQGGSPVPGLNNELSDYSAQWQEAMKIASEVRFLSPVLAMGKRSKTVRLDSENLAIYYLELEHGEMKTLIAVNVADYPVTVTWRFPNLVQPVVLFEDRMLSEKAKEITDMFKPLEVHIYRWM